MALLQAIAPGGVRILNKAMSYHTSDRGLQNDLSDKSEHLATQNMNNKVIWSVVWIPETSGCTRGMGSRLIQSSVED